MTSHSFHTVDILEQALGKEQTSEALTRIISATVCKVLPCSDRVQHQTEKFVCACVKVAVPTIPVLLATLTYLERYFQSSFRFHEDDPLVRSRVIFISLLTAYKYLSERGVLNKAWIRACNYIFTLGDINKMECLFLSVLQYQLMVEDVQTQTSWRNWTEQLMNQAADYTVHQKLSPVSSISASSSSSNASFSVTLSPNNLKSPQASVERPMALSSSKRRFTLPQVAVKWSGWRPVWFMKSPT
ncbi:hypothetical protein BC830DRAFT_476547 [Chytriomyces sp. MP71]|nr:hypothetical protein BC830DRAFT_476547 [Chytriomyces sp. MP71]